MKIDRKVVVGASVLLVSFGLLYHRVIALLVEDWAKDDNYSHGFLIVPLALYLAWERRRKLFEAKPGNSAVGFLVVAGSVLVAALDMHPFVNRLAMLSSLAGVLLYLFGWARLKVLAFPVLFLLLMIPIPAIIFNQIAFPLQLLASRFGEATLMACQIPVLREGNVIQLANTSLEVAEACSGIRSLVSLLTLGIVYGYFSDSRLWVRYVLAIATIPVAIAANAIRVSGTGIAAHLYGAEAAEGFFHSFSGWLVFLVAFSMLFVLHRLVRLAAPRGPVKIRMQTEPGTRIQG